MSRYPSDHRNAVRRRVVVAASEQLRGQGLAATGVRAMMQASGLTHGGFYGYFPTRDALVAEAVAVALAATLASLRAAGDAAPPADRAMAIVTAYLSDLHLAHMARGCAAAALAPEIARADAKVQAAFTAGVEAIVTLLADVIPGAPGDRQARATALFALMMGTLQLARTAPDADAAGRLLASGRDTARRLLTPV